MSLFYDDEEYEYSISNEFENLLADLPFNLIKESILEQIDDPVSIRVNYIDVIQDKLAIYKEQFEENQEALSKINDTINDFFMFIIEKINNKYSLGVDQDSIREVNNIEEIGESMYKYFVLRYSKNITRFITRYIFKNRKYFSERYSEKSKKDVSTLAFRKQIKNKDDLIILTNLPSIISDIINSDITNEEFIHHSVSNDNYDAYIIRSLIHNNILTGDFYDDYIGLCVYNHEHMLDELQTEIRLKIIKEITN